MQAEMAICELRMQDPDFYFDLIYATLEECIIIHIEK
jgi:hypothetical protein